MNPETGFVVVLSTAGSDEEARSVAKVLVEERLAACVNIVSGVHSVYRWRDEVRSDDEWLLVIKTRAQLFEDVRLRIRSLHSYELPEALMIPILDADPQIVQWLAASLAPKLP